MNGFYENSQLFLAIAAVFIIGELLWRKLRGQAYDLGAFGSSAAIFLGQVLLTSVAYGGLILFCWNFAYQLAPFKWSMGDWKVWLAAFLIMEFVYYWQHRLSHTVRWMWATHSVHHSPNEFVLPAAFRLGWTGAISGNWMFYIPVALMGFHPLMIITVLSLGLRYQFFLHTESVGRLGLLENIFNTPSNHRVHHSSQTAYLDKNFGNVLMVFDHLFGTYAAERPGEKIVYGLTDPFVSKNPFYIAFREWIRIGRDVTRAQGAGEAFRAAFGRPQPVHQAGEGSAQRPGFIGPVLLEEK